MDMETTRHHRRHIGIVSCAAAKTDTAAPARDLYTSSVFRGNLVAAIAEFGEDNVMILSAKHGLLRLDQTVAPYDTKMGDADEIADTNLLAQMFQHGIDQAEIYVFGGQTYSNKLWELEGHDALVCQVYEGARGIGDHKRGACLIAG